MYKKHIMDPNIGSHLLYINYVIVKYKILVKIDFKFVSLSGDLPRSLISS